MKKFSFCLILVLCLTLLLSCSSAAKDGSASYPGEAAPNASMGTNPEKPSQGGEVDSNTAVSTDRKLIRTVFLEAETKGYDALLTDLNDRVNAMGGYIEQSTIGGTAYESARQERVAKVIYRIPSAELEAFLAHIADNCNLTSRSESATDVTLQYVDLESRIQTLRAEQTALTTMLEKATSTSDILAIRNQLNDVTYQLETATRQLRTLSEQVEFSTVTVSIREVIEYTEAPAEDDRSAFAKIGDGFVESLKNVGLGLAAFGSFLLINSPYIVLIAGILVVAFFLARWVLKKRNK